MKKILVFALTITASLAGYAQNAAIDKLLLDQYKASKEKSDKDIKNEKNAIKASTWIARAQAYEDIASFYGSLDSNAANVAYDAYKKAIELDATSKKPGKIAKEANDGLKSAKLFQSFIQQGAIYYQNKSYHKALSTFKLASEINPKDTLATMYWGVSAQVLKNDAEAVAAYTKHIELGGKDPITFYVLFSALRDAKNDAKALEVLNKGIAVNPLSKDLKAERTNYYINNGKMEEALVSLKELFAENPNDASTAANIGIIYDNNSIKANSEIFKLENSVNSVSVASEKVANKESQIQAYKEERDRLAAQLKKAPKNADVKRRLGEAETFLKEQSNVLAELKAEEEKAKSQAVDKTAAQTKIAALVKVRDTNRAGALEWYEKTLKLDPNNYDALYNMGVSVFNEAVELKRPYDNLNPNSAEFKNNGKAMEEAFVSKFNKALPYFEKALAVNGKAQEAKDNLCQIYRMLKMEDKAKTVCE
jgi:Flp pilus assembly protein TadD